MSTTTQPPVLNLDLSKFKMDSIKFPPNTESVGPVVVMIGRRDTGKTVLMNDLLFHYQKLQSGVVISGTNLLTQSFSKIIPKTFVYNEYSSSIVENVLRRQYYMVKQEKAEQTAYGRTNIDARSFLILDDCIYDSKFCNDKLMRMIFMNGRHFKLMFILSMQSVLGIPPSLRSNIDYVFILRNANAKDRKKIYENYAGIFPSLESFGSVLDSCTENYECMVINNTVQSNRLQDVVFWYKAELRPQFRMFSPEVWEAAAREPDRDDMMSILGVGGPAKYDASQVRKRSAGPTITVNKGR